MLMDERLGPFREAAEGQVLGTGDTAREPGKSVPLRWGANCEAALPFLYAVKQRLEKKGKTPLPDTHHTAC